MKKRLLLGIGLVLLVLAVVVGIVLYCFPTLRYTLFGEATFRGRPTSYWREVLRGAGPYGNVSPETAVTFDAASDAVPVLLQCVHDKDGRVRSAALTLLRTTRVHSPEVLSAVTQSLRDSDPEVRIAGIGSLSGWGAEASTALPVLTPLVHDPDERVARYAIYGLWQIDVRTAAEAPGWRPIPQDEWGFTAMMPPEVRIEKSKAPNAKSKAVVHFYDAHDDTNSYMISVGQYPDGFFGAMPLEKRLDHARDAVLLIVRSGKLENEEPVELQGRQGRQFEAKLDEKRRMRYRVFWEGDCVYNLMAQTSDEQPNEKAADYFFDSFRFPDKK